ncbi:hypothetical protein DFH29DRAFT_881091 [Suillus ampliporus]|nr:hypothetical protein DFH29DRAFT_881091 [Suillus ampliporus]
MGQQEESHQLYWIMEENKWLPKAKKNERKGPKRPAGERHNFKLKGRWRCLKIFLRVVRPKPGSGGRTVNERSPVSISMRNKKTSHGCLRRQALRTNGIRGVGSIFGATQASLRGDMTSGCTTNHYSGVTLCDARVALEGSLEFRATREIWSPACLIWYILVLDRLQWIHEEIGAKQNFGNHCQWHMLKIFRLKGRALACEELKAESVGSMW